MDFFQNKKVMIPVSIVLAVAILFGATFGIIGLVTRGEKIDCEAEVQTYNSSKPDFSAYFGSTTNAALSPKLDALDAQLSSMISQVGIEKMVYTDTVATFIAKFVAELTQKDFTSLKFKALKKNYPAAYDYVAAKQQAGTTWDNIGTIPFGITAGDKDAFIKACGAGAEHLGDLLLKVVLYAPSAYNDALVPALEALHMGTMSSLFGFVAKTGLSASARIEFLFSKILAIVDPVKQAPLKYLCEMLPDFIVNYKRACDFINGNDKITTKAKLSMPTIESILADVFKALGMVQPPLNLTELSKTGTASVGESAANKGKRVNISGDRQIVFAYLADYILGVLTYQNNFETVKKILTKDLKSDTVANSPFASLLTSPAANQLIATLMDILADLEVRPATDVNAEVEAYNAEVKDYSTLFKWPATEENVSSVLDSIDSTLAGVLADADIGSALFTDSFATVIAKLTAKLCSREFTDITFKALKSAFPAAYDFVVAEQAAGKTWADIDVIPFGITPGDQEMFVKACGAGAEHFGDALALCIMVDPHSYDEALVPLLEALHTGPMPKLYDFVLGQGLDGAKRMEDLANKIITIMEPIKTAPLTYLLEMLPDLIASYNKASALMTNTPNMPINMPELNILLNDIVADLGLKLPEHDFTTYEKMATASVEESGVHCSQRVRLTGDREVVFMSLASYILDVAGHEGNVGALAITVAEAIGIDPSVIETIISAIESLGICGSKEEAPAA